MIFHDSNDIRLGNTTEGNQLLDYAKSREIRSKLVSEKRPLPPLGHDVLSVEVERCLEIGSRL